MDKKQSILGIDDEALNLQILAELLDGEFDLRTLESGEACLEFVADSPPDLILLDVKMPGMDGLETCRRLKGNPVTSSIPIIFVSALSSMSERIAGYEAGGDEYLTKPFDEQELLIKIKNALGYREAMQSLETSSQEAMHMAMTAMTNAGEMGVVMHFMRESFVCRDFQSLGKEVLGALSAYGLDGAVEIRTETGAEHFSSRGAVSSLEISVFEYMLDRGRLRNTDTRMMINFELISLLVNNMPIADPEKYGRLKDHLALLAEGANSRVCALSLELELANQREALAGLVEKTGNTLTQIEQTYRAHQIESGEVLSQLEQNLEHTFMRLGLTEEQEQSLHQTIRTAEQKISALYDSGLELDRQFSSIVDDIQRVLGD